MDFMQVLILQHLKYQYYKIFSSYMNSTHCSPFPQITCHIRTTYAQSRFCSAPRDTDPLEQFISYPHPPEDGNRSRLRSVVRFLVCDDDICPQISITTSKTKTNAPFILARVRKKCHKFLGAVC
jgi:hypothetical protein